MTRAATARAKAAPPSPEPPVAPSGTVVAVLLMVAICGCLVWLAVTTGGTNQ